MEEGNTDFSPYSNGAFTSILGYSQDMTQSGEYSDVKLNELFTTSLRPFDIGPEDHDDLPVSLGTSCIEIGEEDKPISTQSQRDLLRKNNLLRPMHTQGWSKNQLDCQMRGNQEESEFGTQFHISAPAGGACPGSYVSDKVRLPGAIPTQIPAQNWIQEEEPHANEVMTGDRDLVDIYSQDWRSPDNISVVKIEEKAATAAGRFLDTAGQQTGLSTVRDDHLDSPVFSNFTSEEDEVGQFVDHNVSSDEFECDGNCYTSITGNSRE
ncbi:unnamed protein product [Moneuplotes crassus]|uniref:Uncharacterized protein n=1 Tax=Euplotes crassus TaxID=5936 RepID=A0AAD1UKI0_EUPCR|nr:unnamed protein product [Moneuplotes crassus]